VTVRGTPSQPGQGGGGGGVRWDGRWGDVPGAEDPVDRGHGERAEDDGGGPVDVVHRHGVLVRQEEERRRKHLRPPPRRVGGQTGGRALRRGRRLRRCAAGGDGASTAPGRRRRQHWFKIGLPAKASQKLVTTGRNSELAPLKRLRCTAVKAISSESLDCGGPPPLPARSSSPADARQTVPPNLSPKPVARSLLTQPRRAGPCTCHTAAMTAKGMERRPRFHTPGLHLARPTVQRRMIGIAYDTCGGEGGGGGRGVGRGGDVEKMDRSGTGMAGEPDKKWTDRP
jgi:hypothetical protein